MLRKVWSIAFNRGLFVRLPAVLQAEIVNAVFTRVSAGNPEFMRGLLNIFVDISNGFDIMSVNPEDNESRPDAGFAFQNAVTECLYPDSAIDIEFLRLFGADGFELRA